MKKPAVFLLLALHPAFLFASLDLDQVLGNMEVQSKSLQNIKFDFHQEISFFNTTGTTEVRGEALFEKPGKLRILKKGPEEQLTVSDGKKMWVYTPAFNQVWEGSPKKWIRSPLLPKGIVPLDDFVADLKRNFILHLSDKEPGKEGGLWLIAESKNKDLGYNLELCVSTQSWLPVKTVFHSETAKIVTDLLNTEVNLAISSNMFRFLPPEGTEIIPLN